MLDLDHFLPYRLNILSKKVSRALATRYQDRFGITVPEWRVIATLGRQQPLSSNDIVDRTAMDKAKVSRAVSALVGRHYLRREVHEQDQRLLRLSLTAQGRALYDQIAAEAMEWESQWLAGLGLAGLAAGRRDLWDLLARLEAALPAPASPSGPADSPPDPAP